MKKIICLICISFFICKGVFGQLESEKFDIKLGPENRAFKNNTIGAETIGSDESGIYVIRDEGQENIIVLEKYDNAMNIIHSINLNKIEDRNSFTEILMVDGELYFFSEFNDKKAKKKSLFVRKINKTSLDFEGDQKMISTYDWRPSEFYYLGLENLILSTSFKSSKALVYSNFKKKKKENDDFVVTALDENIEKIWEKKIDLPCLDGNFKLLDSKIDENGNAYILGGIIDEGTDNIFSDKPTSYNYEILSFINNGKESYTHKIESKGKFIYDLKLALDENNNLFCAGFYSDDVNSNIKGAFSLILNQKDLTLKGANFMEFPMEIIEGAERLKQKGHSYNLNEIHIENEGLLLIGEQVYKDSGANRNRQGERYIETCFYNNDIVVLSISKEGKIEWTKLIPKFQSNCDLGGEYSSYISMKNNGKLYLLFNDHANNLNRKENGKIYPTNSYDKGIISIVELDSQGNQTKQKLASMKEFGAIRPIICSQVSENELILFLQNLKTPLKKIHRFARLKIN